MRNDVFLDQQGDAAVRQAGAAEVGVTQLYESTRQAASIVSGAFTAGARSDRGSATDLIDGDRWLETDTGLVYYYDSGWHFEVGVAAGADASRFTPSADDNGALFFTTDALTLWKVQSAAWVKLLQIVGTANQVTASIAGGVLTLSLPSSITVATGYQVGGNQIIGARKTGWTLPTSTQTRTNADYSTLTLPQLAEVVAALVNDLHASGGTQQRLLST